MSMDLSEENYPGGFYALMQRLESREAPFRDPLSVLPPPDVDLEALFARKVPQINEIAEGDRRSAPRKWDVLCRDLTDQPEAVAVHAMCIAILRRRTPPEEARELFLRLWREAPEQILALLDVRWCIAAATTFADHGETVEQRLAGQSLSMLFDLIKLHDSERRVSGRANDQAFARLKHRAVDPHMAFGMEPYFLPRGDLDKNMLARIWRLCEADPLIRPLGFAMLRQVMTDKRNIFARIQRYKPKPQD